MTARKNLEKLSRIAQLVLDMKLAELQAASTARQDSLNLLAGLSATPAEDIDAVAAAKTELLYLRWADRRRAEINIVLARQTADWMQKQQAARHSFGQAEVLRNLSLKAVKGRTH